MDEMDIAPYIADITAIASNILGSITLREKINSVANNAAISAIVSNSVLMLLISSPLRADTKLLCNTYYSLFHVFLSLETLPKIL